MPDPVLPPPSFAPDDPTDPPEPRALHQRVLGPGERLVDPGTPPPIQARTDAPPVRPRLNRPPMRVAALADVLETPPPVRPVDPRPPRVTRAEVEAAFTFGEPEPDFGEGPIEAWGPGAGELDIFGTFPPAEDRAHGPEGGSVATLLWGAVGAGLALGGLIAVWALG